MRARVRRGAAAALVSAFCAMPLHAEPALDKAMELIRLTGADALATQMIEQVLPQQFEVIRAANPDLDAELLQRLERGMIQEARASVDEIPPMIARIYVDHFTADELDRLIAFYRTPLGQKAIREMPVIMQEASRVGQEWGADIANRVIERMNAASE